MKRLTLVGILLSCALTASAGNVVSYVSAEGTALNNCSTPALACSTWTRALSETSPDGSIVVISPGDFGLMRITQGVNIQVPQGMWARTRPTGSSGGIAITIDAGPTAVVRINGIEAAPRPTIKDTGIRIVSAGRVELVNVRVGGFNTGIDVEGDQVQVYLKDVHVSDFVNGGNGIGVWLRGQSKLALYGTQITGGDTGFVWDDGHVYWADNQSQGGASNISFTLVNWKIKFTPGVYDPGTGAEITPPVFHVGCGTLPNFNGQGFNGQGSGSQQGSASFVPCSTPFAPWDRGF